MNRGDKCRVRLHNNTVVEAVYLRPSMLDPKCHHLLIFGGEPAIAWGRKPFVGWKGRHCVRFVGNPCVLLHEGVSV